jgi:hypothetical protein
MVVTMAKVGKGKIYGTNGKAWIYIPKDVANDSAFPFKVGDPVKIRVEGEKLIIEKA